MNSIEEMSPDSIKDGTVEITHKTIGPARPSRIRVASHIKVSDFCFFVTSLRILCAYEEEFIPFLADFRFVI